LSGQVGNAGTWRVYSTHLMPGFSECYACLAMKNIGKPCAGKSHARLCVQRRLVCSAGVSPAGVKVRSPVAWIAGWRETKTLKPIDKATERVVASHRAVTKVNAEVASKVRKPWRSST